MNVEQACQIGCELWDEEAPLFEVLTVPLWQQIYSTLTERASITPGARVLDLGTGTGEVAIRARRLLGSNGHVTGVDSSERMLQIAEEKRNKLGLKNLDFRRMSMENLEFTGNSFDYIVSNYAICCSFHYDTVVRGSYRVLKPGGKLLYNHDGPNDSDQFKVIQKIFEKFKVKKPSKRLKRIRDADSLQESMWSKYRDPFVTLRLMRDIGFKNVEATITYHTLNYSDVENYVEHYVKDWKWEVEEMPERDVKGFREEAVEALSPFSRDSGFSVDNEAVYFTGYK